MGGPPWLPALSLPTDSTVPMALLLSMELEAEESMSVRLQRVPGNQNSQIFTWVLIRRYTDPRPSHTPGFLFNSFWNPQQKESQEKS